MSYYTILYMPKNARRRIRLKDLPSSMLPREKLLAKGSENLTSEELIAILLGTGSSKQNVLNLSSKLLRKYPLSKLSNTNALELGKFKGVGKAKAARIMSAIELGKRVFAPSNLNKIVIRSKEDVLTNLRDIVGKQQEYLVVFYLNARDELISREIVGQGSLSSMLITPKEIFAPAIKTPCASIIVAHNHPSGDPNSSDDDIGFTKRIHEAGLVLGIPMLDHLIVSKSGYFSFRDNQVNK